MSSFFLVHELVLVLGVIFIFGINKGWEYSRDSIRSISRFFDVANQLLYANTVCCFTCRYYHL
jgi:hypothetical protein